MVKEGSLRVGFTGGEPTLRRDLDKLVKAGKDNNLLITLTTNGWFVQKIRYFKKIGSHGC